jgi:hypothetical protein
MISLLSNHEREREKAALTSAFPTPWYTHYFIERDKKEGKIYNDRAKAR